MYSDEVYDLLLPTIAWFSGAFMMTDFKHASWQSEMSQSPILSKFIHIENMYTLILVKTKLNKIDQWEHIHLS